MRQRGPGIFFDGRTSARQLVWVELEPGSLVVRGGGSERLVRWPHSALNLIPGPAGVLRLARSDDAVPARLEIRDPALIAAVGSLASRAAGRPLQRAYRRRIILVSMAAGLALVVAGVFGLPALADRVVPLIPLSLERRLGDAVDAQVRSSLTAGRSAQPLECGKAPAETAGRAALDVMIARLLAAAALPIEVKVAVIRRSEANAFALPGGRIYLYQGLLAQAASSDELAGVIAHELGHVAHHDGTKSVVRAAGLSFLFGMVLGDFVGGGAVVIAARTLLQSAYSRKVEAAADAYGVDLMQRAGGDARALSVILPRISGAIEPGMQIFLDHPQTAARVAAIVAAAPVHSGPAMLSPTNWVLVQQICAGS